QTPAARRRQADDPTRSILFYLCRLLLRGRGDRVTGNAETIEQPAELSSIAIRKFRADMTLDCGRVGIPHLFLQLPTGFRYFDDAATLVQRADFSLPEDG